MKQIDWLVRVKSAPTVVRYCKKCASRQEFASSGLFRVNAQQKSLDVWLIYKCGKCNTSWNFTILSRINPRSIPPGVLDGFHSNRGKLALQYALNVALIRQNGGEPGPVGIEVLGEDIDFTQPVRLRLVPQYPIEVKVSSALRGKLGLPRGEYDRLCENRTIRCVSGENLKRCKLSGEVIIEIG